MKEEEEGERGGREEEEGEKEKEKTERLGHFVDDAPHHQEHAGRFRAASRIPRHLGEFQIFSVNSALFREFRAAMKIPRILCEFHARSVNSKYFI